MELIKQNDSRCSILIRKIGCFFRSCLAVAELAVEIPLTAEQINELWEISVTKGYIKGNKIVQSAPIITLALRELGDAGKFVEIGTSQNNLVTKYSGCDACTPDAFIQKIKAQNSDGTHFRVVDNAGNVVFDPYTLDVECLGVFYSILYSYMPGAT